MLPRFKIFSVPNVSIFSIIWKSLSLEVSLCMYSPGSITVHHGQFAMTFTSHKCDNLQWLWHIKITCHICISVWVCWYPKIFQLCIGNFIRQKKYASGSTRHNFRTYIELCFDPYRRLSRKLKLVRFGFSNTSSSSAWHDWGMSVSGALIWMLSSRSCNGWVDIRKYKISSKYFPISQNRNCDGTDSRNISSCTNRGIRI